MSNFFREIDGAVGVLDKKYNDCSRDRYIQRLLPSRGMVARALRKVHSEVPYFETEISKSMVW